LLENQLSFQASEKLHFFPNFTLEVGMAFFEIEAILKFEEIMKTERELAVMMEVTYARV
jgi:hypothetical protein